MWSPPHGLCLLGCPENIWGSISLTLCWSPQDSGPMRCGDRWKRCPHAREREPGRERERMGVVTEKGHVVWGRSQSVGGWSVAARVDTCRRLAWGEAGRGGGRWLGAGVATLVVRGGEPGEKRGRTEREATPCRDLPLQSWLQGRPGLGVRCGARCGVRVPAEVARAGASRWPGALHTATPECGAAGAESPLVGSAWGKLARRALPRCRGHASRWIIT